MSDELTMSRLLTVEDDSAITNYKCSKTGIPIWPGIRNSFLRLIIQDYVLQGTLVEKSRGRSFRQDPISAALSAGKAVAHNLIPGRTLKGPILVTTSGAGLISRNGRWFNRLSDYFALVCPNETVSLEEMFKWEWRSPRTNPRIIFNTDIRLRAYVLGRVLVRSGHRNQAKSLLDLLRSRARQLIGWDLSAERERFLTRLLSMHSAAIPETTGIYRRLLRKVGARVVLKEMGCYGQSAVFNATARSMGVHVAEYQHGVVSRGHDAYNVSASLAGDQEYQRTLPADFLSYGKWWGRQISVPLRQVVVGNPHRSERLAAVNRVCERPRHILVLGDGIQTSLFLRIAKRLADALHGRHSVVFRPHPIERTRVQRECADSSIVVDWESDIYVSLAASHSVVGEVSSGLFEAIGLAERSFVMNTPRSRFSLPEHPFEAFSDIDDLVEKIDNAPTRVVNDLQAADIWAPDWENNYRKFLNSVMPTLLERARGTDGARSAEPGSTTAKD